jgi:DNA-binding phage protein
MAGKLKLKKWNSAAHLKTEADITRYWEACLEEGRDDPSFITTALGTIARAAWDVAARAQDRADAGGPLQGALARR